MRRFPLFEAIGPCINGHPQPERNLTFMTSPLAGFADLGVPAPLVTALDRSGITTPFPIQSATLPDSLAGRDVLGRGRTGSGKTIAFGLPMLAALATSKCGVSRHGPAPSCSCRRASWPTRSQTP